MSPVNDRNRSDAEEEKPRSTRRWVEAPKKRTAEDEEKRQPDDKPRKSGRRHEAGEWDDEDLVDDFDDLEDLEDDLDLDDPDLEDPDFDPDLDHVDDEELLP